MTEVTVAEILAAARRGKAPVAPESAGYLALAVADALVRAPLTISPTSIALSTEGTASLRGGEATSTIEAERNVRALLGALLASSASPTPALGNAARRSASAGVAALVVELEGALIPVNRSAARRALARLARETARVRDDVVESRPARPSSRPAKSSAPPRDPIPAAAPEPAAAESIPFIPPLSPPPVAVVSSDDEPMPEHEVWFTPDPPPPAPLEHTEPLATAAIDAISAEAPDDLTVPLPESRRVLPPSTPRLLIEPEIYLVPGTTPSPPTIAQLIATMPPQRSALEDHSPSFDVVVGTPIVSGLVALELPDSDAPPEAALARAVADVAKIAKSQELEVDLSSPPDAKPTLAAPREETPVTVASSRVESGSTPVPVLGTAPAASVEKLLEAFSTSDHMDERASALALKRSVGLDATPPPPAIVDDVLGRKMHQATREPEQDAEVPPLPEMPRHSPPRAPRATSAVLFGFLLLALGTTITVWVVHPGFFTGH